MPLVGGKHYAYTAAGKKKAARAKKALKAKKKPAKAMKKMGY